MITFFPLSKGQAKSWACGIIHALGMVNFLYDASQTPHLKAKEVYEGFGVAESTGQGKSKQIRDLMKMYQMDPNWCLPSMIEHNRCHPLCQIQLAKDLHQ